MATKKQEVQIALVRGKHDDDYRAMTPAEYLIKKTSGRLFVEKTLVDDTKVGRNYFVTYYVET